MRAEHDGIGPPFPGLLDDDIGNAMTQISTSTPAVLTPRFRTFASAVANILLLPSAAKTLAIDALILAQHQSGANI